MYEYNERQRWALRKLEELIEQVGSQNAACKLVGIGAAIMTPLRKGTYTGNVSKNMSILIDYFAAKEEVRALATTPQEMPRYVKTSVSEQVIDVIRYCQLHGSLAVACGDSGIGKTRAAEKFVEDHPHDAIYIALNPCFTSLKSLLKILCEHLGLTRYSTLDNMWLAIAGKLRDGQVLIFDEAQYLPWRTIEALRALTDRFERDRLTLGIVFIGNTKIVDGWGRNKTAEFAQIRGRMTQETVFDAGMITREDIQLLIPDVASKDKETDFLLELVRGSRQGVRAAMMLWRNALANGNTTLDGLAAMAKATGKRVYA
jgi:DNA transposition AAA+ family ATPase